MSDIREQIDELRRNQGYGGSESAADTMEKLLVALEDIADGNTDSCGDCRYNEERAKQAIQ